MELKLLFIAVGSGVKFQMIFVLNILLIWAFPAVSSEFYHTFSSKDKRLLNDGNLIPAVGFGTAVKNGYEYDDVTQAVIWAIEAGYRHIDASGCYGNEELVGRAIIEAIGCGIVNREELFITAKLDLEANTRKKVVPALKKALRQLQLDYVDLFLICTPYSAVGAKKFDILDIWFGLEDAKKLGLTKSIGVSNFKIEHLCRILEYCTTRPAVNEIEVNPTYTNIELVKYCQKEGIIVTAYAPFGYTVRRPGVTSPPPPSLKDPVLVNIAKNHSVTPSQVVLRYLIDRGTIPIPRSTNKEHIRLNLDILKFSLTDEEVEKINGFNRNLPVYGDFKSAPVNVKDRSKHARSGSK